jgi:hypothetical protein
MILANKEQKAQLTCFQNQANLYDPEEKIRMYTQLYDQLHIKDITQQKITRFHELAIRELTSLNAPPGALTELKKLGRMLIQRES